MKHEGWAARVPPRQISRLERFEALLRARALPRGMIASSDLPHLRERHVADSLRGAPHIGPDVRRACDLGSGAGLPGVPLAIVRPDAQFVLTEPRRARAAFLEFVVEELDLTNVAVFPGRVQELDEGFDVCLARGFGSAESSWSAAERVLRPNGSLLYWAGRSFSRREWPSGAAVSMAPELTLESGGPIVIMTRQ